MVGGHQYSRRYGDSENPVLTRSSFGMHLYNRSQRRGEQHNRYPDARPSCWMPHLPCLLAFKDG